MATPIIDVKLYAFTFLISPDGTTFVAVKIKETVGKRFFNASKIR